jgi:hypothetical protein
MAGLCAEQAESAPAEGRGAAGSGRPGRHKAAAPTFAVTSGPAATPTADRASFWTAARIEGAGPSRRIRLKFRAVACSGRLAAFKIGLRGRRFLSDTGDQRVQEHDEARYDKRGPHKDN